MVSPAPAHTTATAQRAHEALARWAEQVHLQARAVRGAERWVLPNGTVVLWFYPPTSRWPGGVQLNLLRLHREGRDDVVRQVADALAGSGVALDNPDHPSIPCSAIARHPGAVLDRALAPYVAAYEQLDTSA